MDNFKLALLNIKMNYRNAKELKLAFISSIIGMCINNLAFIVIWVNFGAIVGNLNGWDKYDIFLLYGFTTTSYGIVFSLFYGIMSIPKYITTGSLDKYLITPKNTLIKVATSTISISAIGDLIFGIVCFIIYAALTKLTLIDIFLFFVLLICTSVIFFSFTLISMSLSFYFMDGENISSGVFQLFLTPSFYHGGAFNKFLRVIFIYFIPALLLGAVQVELIKGISSFSYIFIFLMTLIFLIISIIFFYKSLRKYESNNFFGYGN